MKRKVISIILVISMLMGISAPIFASTPSPIIPNERSIKIEFNNTQTNSYNANSDTNSYILNSDEVTTFFTENGLDYDYYMNWIVSLNNPSLETVSFTIADENLYPSSRSVIQGDRIVYAETVVHSIEKNNPLSIGSKFVAAINKAITISIAEFGIEIISLAAILGISKTDQDKYKDEMVTDGTSCYKTSCYGRLVFKFVELNAPVSGVTKWYPWGYAQAEYGSINVHLYKKGVPQQNTTLYSQNYTENYYNVSKLTSLVKAAYPKNTYQEAASKNAATAGGYSLYSRDISKSMFSEYDNLTVKN